jgi:hypothetical protein
LEKIINKDTQYRKTRENMWIGRCLIPNTRDSTGRQRNICLNCAEKNSG